MLENIEFRVATGACVDAAIQTREQIFLRDFGHTGDDGRDSLGYHLIAVTTEGEVVAGFRLLGPDARPFPFECVLDLSPVTEQGSRPALLGRLFVRHEYRTAGRSTYLLFGLFALAQRFASANDITDFYISAFDRLIPFYARVGFRDLGIPVDDAHWRTLHLMHLTIRHP